MCPVQAVSHEDQLQINPGSATGAYSTFGQAVQPSFVLMDLDGGKVGGSHAVLVWALATSRDEGVLGIAHC